LGPAQFLAPGPPRYATRGNSTVAGHLGDEEKGETPSLEEVMSDSRFTQAERESQHEFRNAISYCEGFAISYGRIMSPSMIRLRRAWFQIHKWLGIALAILIIPISLSGAALVWHDWLDEQVNPQRFPAVSAPLLPANAYAAAAVRFAEPDERIVGMSFPDERGSVQVTLTKPPTGTGRPARAWIWLDPKTAEPIERAGTGEGLVRVLHVLHGSLMVPGTGRQVVGWIGVAMLFSSLTGLWLWWPLKGRVREGFRWKRRPDLNSNLHHLGGFWIALPLAVLSATGVWISFPSVFSQAAAGPRPALSQPLAQPRLTPEQVLAVASPQAAGSRLVSIEWPTGNQPEWNVTFAGRGTPMVVKVKEADSSASLTPPKPEPLARTMRRIHDGTGMPVVWQIIIFAGGILPAVLAVTGSLMWLRMRRRRARHRRALGDLVEAEALAS